MEQYPKALYLGHTDSHQFEIAEDEQHEQELRTSGYVDFAELTDTPIEEVIDTAEQLQLVRGEFIAFQNNAEAMKARIAELETKPDYSAMTVEQLRDEIKQQGKESKSSDNKPDLIAILED